MPKYIVFLDLKDVHTYVELPTDMGQNEHVESATLLHWNVEGLPEQNVDYTAGGFYIQVKFDGCLQTRTVAHGARPDMLQIPVKSFNGWGISPHTLPINLARQKTSRRFGVHLYQEGEAPAELAPADGASLRVVLWVELNTSRD